MKLGKRYILNLLRAAIVMLFFSAFFSHCASILTPTGGPRDSLPPVIVAMTPNNYSTEVDAKKIFIEFDEFVQIKDQQKEFYTSPAMKKKPTIYLRGRGIGIDIKDTLLENTTYALNFGSSIRDNNEGNPLNSMRFVFSTGKTIDSMIVSGYTADSYKADSVSKSFIYFFPVDSIENVAEYDSTLFKYQPAAIARAENNGIFIAQNLKPIKYRVYAYEDTNGNQMYEPGTDQVGFLSEDIAPQELPQFAIWFDSIRMYPSADPQLYFRMFTDATFKRQVLQGSERPLQHQAKLYFNAPYPDIESITFDSIPSNDVIIEEVTRGRDTLSLWFKSPKEMLPDTIRTVVAYYKHDSINNLILTRDTIKLSWRMIETKEQEKLRIEKEASRDAALASGEPWRDPDKPFKYKMSLTGEINPERHLSIDFDYPLASVDTSKLLLTRMDADSIITDQPFRFEQDTANIRRYYFRSDWDGKPTDKYTLTIKEDAIFDIAGYGNDSLVGSYTLSDPDKYATVLIHMTTAEATSNKYIIQLLDGNNKLLEEKRDLVAGDLQFNYVPAGDIRLRLIEDTNGNGEWDTGNVVERRQAERSEIYSKDGEDTFATKVQWEVELNIDMAQVFAPVTMDMLVKTLEDREIQRAEKQRIADQEAAIKKAQQQQKQNSSSGGFNMSNLTQQF
ncbi:MAG: Ig-like domain-containing protein [Rikenellaceae bacterium]